MCWQVCLPAEFYAVVAATDVGDGGGAVSHYEVGEIERLVGDEGVAGEGVADGELAVLRLLYDELRGTGAAEDAHSVGGPQHADAAADGEG